jgi:hypothetical protein
MSLQLHASPVVRQFHCDVELPERAPLPGLREVKFTSLAGRQAERPTHALARSTATIQLLEPSSDTRRPVLNGISFEISAFLEAAQLYVTVGGFCKQLPKFDNITAGALAKQSFWRDSTVLDPSQTMHEIWQQALDELAENAVALRTKIPVGDLDSVQISMKSELEQLLAGCSDVLMRRTSEEIQSRHTDESR